MNIWRKLKRVVANPAHYTDHYYQKLKDRCLERRAEAMERRDAAYFLSLKDKYKGQRGFVIGNGPSLKLDDLNMLIQEVSIASNKIFMIFKDTPWRPTVYSIVDDLVWEKIYDQLPAKKLVPVITSQLPAKSIPHHTAKYLGNAADLYSSGQGLCFSQNVCEGFYGGYSVTFENLQLAAHMGLNPIYLIGCDHYYHGESEVTPQSQVTEGTQANHFIPGYRAPGEIVNPAPIKEMTQAYEVAKKYGDEHGIKIYNATRGGHLEAFPRVCFDELF